MSLGELGDPALRIPILMWSEDLVTPVYPLVYFAMASEPSHCLYFPDLMISTPLPPNSLLPYLYLTIQDIDGIR